MTTFFAGRDGNRLAVDVDGPEDGDPVVLLHGGGQTRHSWHTTHKVLSESGWRTYSVDLRGHGESDWAADGDYTMDAFAGDVSALVAGIGRPPALVGASLGGLSALAALGPEPGLGSALVLVDVAPRTEDTGRQRIGAFMMERMETGFASLDEVADAVAAYNPHRPRPKELSGLRRNLRQRDGRWYWHWDPAFISGRRGSPDETRTSVFDPEALEKAAHGLRIPVLLVRGVVSDLLSEEGARAFLDMVPHAEFVSVAAAGHMVAGDRNDAFNSAVVAFLERRV